MYVRGLPVPTTCANMDDDDDNGGSGAGVSFKRLSASRDDTIDGKCAAGFIFISLGFSDVGDGACYEPDRNSSNIPSGHQYSQVITFKDW